MILGTHLSYSFQVDTRVQRSDKVFVVLSSLSPFVSSLSSSFSSLSSSFSSSLSSFSSHGHHLRVS